MRLLAPTLRVTGLVVGFTVVLVATLYAIGHLGLSAHRLQPTMPAVPAEPSGDVVLIHWNAADLAPAAHNGRLCVDDGVHGRICALFVAGERPSDALTRGIELRGLRVESVG